MDTESVHVGFLVDKVAVGQDSFLVLLFLPVTIITPMLHINFNLSATLNRRTSGRSMGFFKENIAFGNVRENWA